VANTIEILVTAKNLTKPTFDTVGEQARTIGQKSGEEFSKGFEDEVKDKLPPAVDEPLNDLPPKGKEKGKETGQQFSAGLSPLLLAAFTGAATLGPAAILAGVSTVVVGAEALLAGSNKQVAQDASILGEQVKTSLTNAVAPIAGDIDAGINTLEQGVTRVTPQLDQLFSAAGPDATELASGLDQLAEGALPGIVSGIKAFAPEMHDVAADFGKIGQGVGGLISGLSVGAGGSTTAFNALSKSLSELLPDVGQIIGYLSNGLGPALSDIVPVVDGAAKALTVLTGALSPGEIQAAGVAFAGLFTAFKGASLVGALKEGATFTSFLKGSGVAAAEAEGKVASFASKGIGALSSALDVATGPLGLIIAGAGLLGNELGKVSGVGDHTAANVDALTSAMSDAANGSAAAQGKLDEFANAMQFMANASGGRATDGIKSIDSALTQLFQTNPQQAATEFGLLSKSLEANGENASDVAKEFPQYTKAVADAQLQSHLMGSQTDQLTASLIGSATAAKTSADQTAAQALAALGATDGQNQLNIALDKSISDYEQASGQSSAYKTALDALYGKYQGYSAAQAAFTTDLANTATQLTKGKDAIDLSTAAGAANFTQLSNLATQNEQVAETLLKQSGSQDKANKSLQDGALKIDALAKSAGFTDTQIAQLNTDLYGTASIKDIAVHVSANTADAYAAVGGFLSYVNSSGATIHVYETASGVYNTGMTAHAKATGGIVGGIGAAATGGVRGSWTLTDEQGPELKKLPFGTQVFSAPDSARMMAEAAQGGAGGPSGAWELSVAEGSDTAVATMIMRLVRDGKLTIKQKAIVK